MMSQPYVKKRFFLNAVERLYRQLKSNYEEKKDYKRVGDFHYGEMEMHRFGKPIYGWGSLYWFYWLLNGYGEKPLRAIICFIILLLILTSSLNWLGLKIISCGNPASFSETFRFVIDKATLQRPDWARPVTELGTLARCHDGLYHPRPISPLFPGLAQPVGPAAVA